MAGAKLLSRLGGALLLIVTLIGGQPSRASSIKTYTYDSLGRVAVVSDVASGWQVTYSYDAAGNRTQVLTAIVITDSSPPAAQNMTWSVPENTTSSILPTTLGGQAKVISVLSQPSHGTASVSVTNRLVYQPTHNYDGPDTFQYTATNTAGSSSATISLTVYPIPPIVGSTGLTVAYGSSNNPATLILSGGHPTAVSVSTQASHGVAAASGTSITYTPTAGFYGTDTFWYTASNTAGPAAAPAEIVVAVLPPPPVVGPVSLLVNPNTTGLVAPAFVGGGPPGTLAISTPPSHGTAYVSGLAMDYISAAGYAGPDSFQYTATNTGGVSAPATVTILVVAPPIAQTTYVTLTENSSNNPISLSIGGGAPASVAVGQQAVHGVATASGVTISYTPTPGFYGTDTFSFIATNAGGTSQPAWVGVTIQPAPPVVGPVSLLVNPNTTGLVAPAFVGGGPPGTLAISTPPSHGTAYVSGLAMDYISAAGYAGPDSFQYTATNTGGVSAPATVTILVVAPPIAQTTYVTLTENSSNNPISLSIGGGAPASVAVGQQAVHGVATASGVTISYTPTPGFYGTDTFSFIATNAGGTSQPAWVGVTIQPPPPIANAVSVLVNPNTGGDLVIPNLTGGPAATLAISDQPSHGTVSISGLAMSYAPTSGYAGSDGFQYTATGPGGVSAPALVSITVGGATPIPQPVSAIVPMNCSSCGIAGVIAGPGYWAVGIYSQPSHGTVSASGPYFSYTPTIGYLGPDSFQYFANNAAGNSGPATVSVSVVIPDVALQAQSGVTITSPYGGTNTFAAVGLDSVYFSTNLSAGPGFQALKYDFGSSKSITSFSIDGTDWWDGGTGAATIEVRGSNDNSTWTTLASYSYSTLNVQNKGPTSVGGASYRYLAIVPTAFMTNGYLNVDRFNVLGH